MMTKTMIKALAVLVLSLSACAGPTGPTSTGTGAAGEGGGWHWTGGGGTGGDGGTTLITTSSSSSSSTAPVNPTLNELKGLCTTTGGTVKQAQCCSDMGQMPATCMTGGPSCGQVITCTIAVDPDLWLCACPEGECFDQETGCSSPS